MSICSLVVLCIAVGGFVYYKKQKQELGLGKGLSGYVLGEGLEPGLTEEEIKELMQKQVDESKVVFSIYTEPTFNGKKGTIMFANPRNNAHNIDLSVEVDGKTVIKTEKIAPNQYIEEIELMGRPLKKGKHNGDAMITAYRQGTDEVVGQVSVELDITSE